MRPFSSSRSILVWFFALAPGLFLTSGCCRIEQGVFLGEFSLLTGSENWFPFSAGNTVRFESSDGQEEVFQYGAIERFQEESATGCISSECATECDEYRSEVIISQLKSLVSGYQIDMQISKDFDLYSPYEPAAEIKDKITLRLNGSYTCIQRELPEANPNQTITLNGRTFNQVVVCELTVAEAETGEPSAIYYSKTQGVVGFRIGKSQVWRLK